MVRPGGRTEANRKAVAEAVLKMLAEGNLLFDIQDVAEMSGVHRTTIRRRWRDRDTLMAEAMAAHTARLHVDPSGDWKAVLRRIAFALRDFMNDPVEDALNRLIAVSASESFTRLVRIHWQRVYDDLGAPLVEAQKRGRFSARTDIPMILRAIAATILTRAVYTRQPAEDAFVESLVAQIIRGVQPERRGR